MQVLPLGNNSNLNVCSADGDSATGSCRGSRTILELIKVSISGSEDSG